MGLQVTCREAANSTELAHNPKLILQVWKAELQFSH